MTTIDLFRNPKKLLADVNLLSNAAMMEKITCFGHRQMKFSALRDSRVPSLQLKTLLPVGALALALGALGSPAKAVTGSLNFQDGTNDFFSDVNTGVPGDTVTVNFQPGDGGVFVTNATGDFVPPFPAIPPSTPSVVTPVTGVFTLLPGGSPLAGFYSLNSDLAFNFTGIGSPTNLTIYSGTYFSYVFDGNLNSYQFDISPTTPDSVPIPTVTGIGEVVTVTGGSFQFSDTAGPSLGSYRIQVDVDRPAVPGPLPIIGAGVAFGYSRKLRGRIKLSIKS
jgi:hypothetical protein